MLHSTLRHAIWQEPNLNIFYFGRVRWSWKNWFWTVSTLGGCGGLEITDFEQFLLWEGVLVLKELILNSFYFGRVWWSWKNWFWTFSTLGGCGVLKNWFWTTLGGCVWNNWFWHTGRVWLSWKNLILGASTLGGCGLERCLESFYWRVWCLELILNIFYFGRVYMSWKNWFWTVSKAKLGHLVVLKSWLPTPNFRDLGGYLVWNNWFWESSTNLGGCLPAIEPDFEV